MRVRVDWQTIGTLNIRVRAGQVRENSRRGKEPWTPTSRDDVSQHISLAVCFHLQLRNHSFAHHTRSILGKFHFASFVQKHLFREASFATMLFRSMSHLTALHKLSLATQSGCLRHALVREGGRSVSEFVLFFVLVFVVGNA